MSGGEEEQEEEDVPQQVEDLAQASVPNSMKNIRACKRCGILKTIEQFVDDGCENCPFLGIVSFKIRPQAGRAGGVVVTVVNTTLCRGVVNSVGEPMNKDSS